jgi:hypothetical protein
MPVEQIAARHNMSVEAVNAGLQRMEAHRSLCSNELFDMEVNAMLMGHMGQISKVIGEGLKAQIVITGKDPEDGKTKVIFRTPDTATRFKAIEEARKLNELTRPKGPGVAVNIQNNNNQNNTTATGRSYEDVLRAARDRRGLANEEAIKDAAYEDVDETEEDDEELEGDDCDESTTQEHSS